MPISARKLASNRANAQKSTGPTSAAGREKVSQNRIRHGLAGTFHILSCEDVSVFNELLDRFIKSEQPANDVELALVERMAQHYWLSQRALLLQDGCMLVQPQTEEQKENYMHGIAVRSDLDLYLRYHVQHDRAFQRASRELRERRKERANEARGFESQKRAEAAEQRAQAGEQRRQNEELRRQNQEQRRQNDENRKAGKHKLEIAAAQERLDREMAESMATATRLARQLQLAAA